MIPQLTQMGTPDPHTGVPRVYGGDQNLVHIPDGERRSVGVIIADLTERTIRQFSENPDRPLICPGCAMVALFNACVTMADRSCQSRRELARTMSLAFDLLAEDPGRGVTEEIEVILDCD